MPFILRRDGDTENPSLACPYGLQITAGKVAYYINENGRTKVIVFLGEGEMDGINQLYYKGNLYPEVDVTTGERLYQFHPGTLSTGFNDPIQGRPYFFPGVDYTFSGIAYVEINLLTDHSDTEEEPTDFKIFVRGKRVQNYDANGNLADINGVAYPDQNNLPTQTKFFSANNALVAVDIMLNGMSIEKNRIDFPSFVTYRDYCAELINWNSGTDATATNSSWTHHNTSLYGEGTISKTIGTFSGFDSIANTVSSTNGNNAEISGIYRGGDVIIGLTKDVTVASVYSSTYPPVYFYFRTGLNRLSAFVGVTEYEITTLDNLYGATVKIKVTSDGVLFYMNDSLVHTAPLASLNVGNTNPIRGTVAFNSPYSYFDGLKFYPVQGDERRVERFNAHVVFPTETAGTTALEAVMTRSPGCQWQDVGGKVTFVVGSQVKELDDPTLKAGDRVIAGRLVYDPTQTIIKSNIVSDSFSAFKKPTEEKANFLRLEYRDLDDPYFTKKYVYCERNNLKEQAGTIVDPGIISLGVCNQSSAERIGESILRFGSDLDLFLQVSGQANTFAFAKGDVIRVAHDVPDWNIGEEPLFLITEELFDSNIETADERTFLLQIYNDNYYSDSAHGPITGSFPLVGDNVSRLTAPPYVTGLLLTTDNTILPDGTIVPRINGTVTVGNYPYRQQVQIWVKRPNESEFVLAPVPPMVSDPDNPSTLGFSMDAGSGTYEIRAVSSTLTGILIYPMSSHVTESITINSNPSQSIPNPSGSMTRAYENGLVVWSWEASPDDSTVDYYELRNADNGNVIFRGKALQYAETIKNGVMNRIVFAHNSTGYSATGASSNYTLNSPSQVSSFDSSLFKNQLYYGWNANTLSEEIDYYEISTVSNFATVLWRGKATSFIETPTDVSSRTLTRYIRAVNAYGNAGTTATLTKTYIQLDRPSITQVSGYPSSLIIKITPPNGINRNAVINTVVQVSTTSNFTSIIETQTMDGLEENAIIQGRATIGTVYIRAYYVDIFGNGLSSNDGFTYTFVTFANSDLGAESVNTTQLVNNSITNSKVASDAITANNLVAGAVTNAKLASNAVDTINLVANAVTNAKIATGAVGSGQLVDASVIAGKLALNAVTNGTIATDAITANNILAGAITALKLATDSVTSNSILAGSIVTSKIATDAVTSNNILAGAITAGKIATDAVTANNIAAGSITAVKLSIGSFSALNGDSEPRDITSWPLFPAPSANATGSIQIVSDGKAGTTVLRSANGIPSWHYSLPVALDPTKQYKVHTWVRNVTGNGTFSLAVALFDANNNNITGAGTLWLYPTLNANPGGWTEYAGVFGAGTANTFPSNARKISVAVIMNFGGNTGYYEVQDIRLEEMITSAIIADGAIVADKIVANSITALQLANGAVGDAQINTSSGFYRNAMSKVQSPISGGGTITWSGTSLSWTSRFIVIPTALGSSGYFDLGPNASGIAIPAWNALVYRTQIGSSYNSANSGGLIAWNASSSGYFVVDYSTLANSTTPTGYTDWLIAINQNDSNRLTLFDGRLLSSGQVIDNAQFIPNGSIIANHMTVNSILSSAIAADAIVAGKIATDAITANNIAAGAITATKIAVGAVTADKISAATAEAGIIFTDQMLSKDYREHQPDGILFERVTWHRLNGDAVFDSDGGVTFGGNASWNNGAESTRGLYYGDGILEFIVRKEWLSTATNLMIGFGYNTSQATSQLYNYAAIDYAMYIVSNGSGTNTLYCYEEGSSIGSISSSLAEGDILRIEISGNNVIYRKNNVVLRTNTSGNVKYPLQASISNNGASISSGIISIRGRIQNVNVPISTWGTLQNTYTSGTSIYRTSGSGWDNTAGYSIETQDNGEAYVQNTYIGVNNRDTFFGLINSTTSISSYTSIPAAWHYSTDGNAYPYVSGSSIGTSSTPTAGDVYRIAIENGITVWRRNGIIQHSQNITWTYPLRVVTTIGSTTKFLDKVLFGRFGIGQGFKIHPRYGTAFKGVGEFNEGFLIRNTPITDVAARALRAVGSDLRYKGNDFGVVPRDFTVAFNGTTQCITNIRIANKYTTLDDMVYVEVCADINGYRSFVESNSDTIDMARVTVMDVFGNIVANFPEMGYAGSGVVGAGYYPRSFAEPTFDGNTGDGSSWAHFAIFKVEIRNKYGWSQPIYFQNNVTSRSLTMPTLANISDRNTNVVANAISESKISVSWTNNVNGRATTAWIRKRGDNGFVIPSQSASGTVITITGLSSNTDYEIILIGDSSGSYPSACVSVKTLAVPPAPVYLAPSGLSGSATSTTQNDMAWTANGTSITDVELSENGGTPFSVGNVTSYSRTGRTANTTYTYKVRNVYAGGTSAWSNEITITTPANPPSVHNPTGLNGYSNGYSSIVLNWTTNGGDSTQIYYRLYGSSTWIYYDIISGSLGTYTFYGLSDSTTYEFYVFNTNGNTASNTIQVTTDFYNPPPDNPYCITLDMWVLLKGYTYKRAADVIIGDKLLSISANGDVTYSEVLGINSGKTTQVYVIISETGHTLRCSPSHPIINGFDDLNGKPAMFYKTNDKILVYSSTTGKAIETKIKAIEILERSEDVVIFNLADGAHTFVADCSKNGGIVSHNLKPYYDY